MKNGTDKRQQFIGRFYTRGRIIHLHELEKTFVVRRVMRQSLLILQLYGNLINSSVVSS